MEHRFIKQIKINWDGISKNSYLREIDTLKNISKFNFNSNITFFVGENGSGKSTLLEGIAVAYGFNPEGGTINYRFSTYYDVSELGENMKLIKGIIRPKSSYFFRAETFFNVATKSLEYEERDDVTLYGNKKLHQQSHGESFISFFHTFDKQGLYILDEPEAALSPQRQLALFIQIKQMAEKGSQFIIATHSPILLGIPDAQIINFDDGEMRECNYKETESYKVTEMFINNKDALLRNLFD